MPMKMTFVQDDFKKALFDGMSQFCRDCTGMKVGAIESHYMDRLSQLIADPDQTNEGLIDALMTYLPHMQVDVMFFGFRVCKRQSKLAGYIKGVLKKYPLSDLNAMEVKRFRSLFGSMGGSEAAGLEKAELIQRLALKHKELADARARIDVLEGDKAGLEIDLAERVREAGLRITELMQDNIKLRQEKSDLARRLASQEAKTSQLEVSVERTNQLLRDFMRTSRPLAASINGDESTPLIAVLG